MQDEAKTREQLLTELQGLRKQLARLQTYQDGSQQGEGLQQSQHHDGPHHRLYLESTGTDSVGYEKLRDDFHRLMLEQRTILDTANVVISLVRDRKQVWVNRKAEEMFQYPREELVNQTTRKLYPSQEAYEQLGREAYPVLAQGLTYETVQRLVRRDGSHIWVKYNGRAVDPPDLSVGTLWILEDITERKLMEEALQRAHHELELRVAERTQQLMQVNEELLREVAERKRTEEALRQSEERYRLLMDTANEGIWSMDAEHQTVYVNQAMADMLGYKPEEMLGKHVEEFFFPEDTLFHQQRMAKRHAGEDEIYERRFRKRDGSALWTLVSAKAQKDPEGAFAGSFAMFKDITERKLGEERIHKVSLVQASLHDPGTLYEKLKRITDAVVDIFNADFARIWLMGPGDHCQTGCMHADAAQGIHACRHRDRCLHLMASAGRYTHLDGEAHFRVPFGCYKIGRLASGEEASFLTNDVTRDQRIHNHEWARALGLVSFAGYQLRPPHGETIGVLALFSKNPLSSEEDALLKNLSNLVVGVIQTTQAEETARENEMRLNLALEAAQAGVWDWDLVSGKHVWSETQEALFGYAPGSFPATTDGFARRIHPDDLSGLQQAEQKARETGNSFHHEYRVVWPDGTVRWVVTNGRYLFNAQGQPLRVVGVLFDITRRKEAEEALRALSSRHQAILEAIPDIIMEVDENRVYHWANPAGFGFFGNDVLGRSAEHYFMVDQGTFDAVQPLFEGQDQVIYVENWQRRKDGEVRLLAWWCRALKDARGKVTGALSTARDITEKKQTELALVRSNQENETFKEIASVFLTVPDENIHEEVLKVVLSSMNSEVGSFALLTQSGDLVMSSMTGDAWSGCQAPEKTIVYDAHTWGRTIWGKAVKEQLSYFSEGPFKTPQGHVPIHSFLAVPILFGPKTIGLLSVANKDGGYSEDDKEQLERIAGFLSPILNARFERDRQQRQREEAEEALKVSEQRFRDVSEASGGFIWEVDRQGCFTYISDRVTKILGYRPDEVLGHRGLEYMEEPEARRTEVIWKDRARAKTGFRESQHQVISRDGVRIWLSVTAVPVLSRKHRLLGFRGTAVDISEHKQAEEERLRLGERLQRAEKMEALGTLAGGVAHDLNNVLGIVVGYSELLLDDLDEFNPARAEAMEVLKGGQRAAAIVQDLLTLARRGVASRTVLNLNRIIREGQESPEFTSVLNAHPGVHIETDLEPDLLNVLGSSVHLEKSLLNLVANAAEAMPQGGILTLKTANRYLDKPISGYDEVREGDYVVLSVADAGEGIPVADLKRIFEPFYTKKIMGRSGTGLGLAVVWGTVKDHLGYINVESEEGRGTVFTLYFPVTRDELTPDRISVSVAEYLAKGESILVVDDVREQRQLASTMLEKLKYAVKSVASGEAAVQYLTKHTVDLVVLDMIMEPGMDGLDTYRRILEIHPHQKAILVSGFAETERVKKAQALGAGAYVKKPYVLEKLGLAVRKELEGRP